jgi:cytochrome P450
MGSMTDVEIANETSNLIFAGAGCTSASLTYIFYLLSQNPDLQQLLYQELWSLDAIGSTFSFKDLVGWKSLMWSSMKHFVYTWLPPQAC